MDIVRVWSGNPTSGGSFNGTAFFINESTLITAKHVVENIDNIYLNEIPNGGILPISKDDIVLCKRDIAIINLKRRYDIKEKSFIHDMKHGQQVDINGYFDDHSEVNKSSHQISGYDNELHTYSIQHSSSKGISGSPVLLNNKICGIAQARSTDKNITYIIPIEEAFKEEYLTLPKIKRSYNALTTLPSRNANFVGRKDELKKLKKSFSDADSDNTVHIVNGIGGVGKSDLALEYLHQNLYSYENIIFIDLTEGNLENTLSRTLRTTLKLQDDDDLDEITRKLQKLPKQNLIIIDNIINKEDFKKIEPLKLNFDILITTRLKNNTQNELDLDVLNPEDAKELFLKYYETDEDIIDILVHLDYHSLFIELTAKTLAEGNITLIKLREKFQNGEFAKINRDFDNTFNDYLLERFKIEDNETLKLLLQRLAIFPSIEIDFKLLDKSLNDDKLHLKLNELSKRGWLSKKADSYKLHQIIKEFILENYKLEFEECKDIINQISDYLNPKDAYLNPLKETSYIPIIESILSLYENKEKNIANLLESIAYIYESLGHYTTSFSYFNQSFEIRKQISDDKHPDLADSYNNISNIYTALGKNEKALDYQLKSINIREEILDDKHPDLANSYNNTARVYQAIGKNEKALVYQLKAINILEEILDEKHPNLATSYSNISTIYHDLGKNKNALVYQLKSINIREEILDDKHPDLANSYGNIAAVYKALVENEKALDYQLKSINIQEEILDEKHPYLANSYNNISMIYQDLRKIEKALEYQLKAVDIREEILDEKHPNLAYSYNNISLIYSDIKKCEKAKEYGQKAVDIFSSFEYEPKELFTCQQNLKSIKEKIKKATKLGLKRGKKVCIDL